MRRGKIRLAPQRARGRDIVTTLRTHEPNFARPVAPHRGRIYLGVGLLTGIVFLGRTFGVEFGFISPDFTSDVIANLLFGIPVLLVPFTS